MRKTLACVLLTALLAAGCGTSESALTGVPAPPPAQPFGLGFVPTPPDQLDEFAEALDIEDLQPDALASPRFGRASSHLVPVASLPPVQNQGQLMSCAAFGIAYSLISHVAGQGQRDLSQAVNQCSPGYMYRIAIQKLNQTCEANQKFGGTFSSDYFDTAVFFGGASLQAVGYPGPNLDPVAQCRFIQAIDTSGRADPRFAIGSWTSLNPKDPDRIKGYLESGQILAVAVQVPENMSTFSGSGVFHGSGRSIGGHIMALIGYDDQRQAFRLQNSWSTGWGDEGYLWMAYSTFQTIATEVYSAAPVRTEPAQSLLAATFVSGDPGARPPVGSLVRAHQEPGQGGTVLVFFYQFDAGVLLQSVVLQSPTGKRIRHLFNFSTRNGYYYFTRQDGQQWLPGNYPVELNVVAADGSAFACRGTLVLEAIPGSGLPAGDIPSSVTGVDGRPAENL
ncbi:MAG: C1 family peptidase [Candidatus Eremiobacterota bacterium]